MIGRVGLPFGDGRRGPVVSGTGGSLRIRAERVVGMPAVVSRGEWRSARRVLQEMERAASKARDSWLAARSRHPWVPLERELTVRGSAGTLPLPELFDGLASLCLLHLTWIDGWDEACPGCAAIVEMTVGNPRVLRRLRTRGIAFAAISSAPFPKLDDYAARVQWRFPWYTTNGRELDRLLQDGLPSPPSGREDFAVPGRLHVPEPGDEHLHPGGAGITVLHRAGGDLYHALSAADGGDPLRGAIELLSLAGTDPR